MVSWSTASMVPLPWVIGLVTGPNYGNSHENRAGIDEIGVSLALS